MSIPRRLPRRVPGSPSRAPMARSAYATAEMRARHAVFTLALTALCVVVVGHDWHDPKVGKTVLIDHLADMRPFAPQAAARLPFKTTSTSHYWIPPSGACCAG